MLFHGVWEFVDTSEAGERRSLAVFAKWQPPDGADFQGFYGFADGTGGVALVRGRQRRHAQPHDRAVDAVAAIHRQADPADRGVDGDRAGAMAFRDSVG